jgi:hypothetical protein
MHKTTSDKKQQLYKLANAALYWAGYFETRTHPNSSYPYKGDIIDTAQVPLERLAHLLALMCNA